MHLPKHWRASLRSGLLHAVSLARVALIEVQSTFSGKCEHERLRQEVALLREELRIKDARLERLPPHRRPHYQPVERLAILELRAARGWSLPQAARVFQVTPATLRHWMRRIDEQGPHALVQLREPVNKFPEYVACLVQRLKTLCPTMVHFRSPRRSPARGCTSPRRPLRGCSRRRLGPLLLRKNLR